MRAGFFRIAICCAVVSLCSCNIKENPLPVSMEGFGQAQLYLPSIGTTGLAKSMGIDTVSRFEIVIEAPDMAPIVQSWNLWNLPAGPVYIDQIPAGYSRLFTGRLINATGMITHEGQSYADVYPGQLVTVYLKLLKKQDGQAVICVEIEGYPAPDCAPGNGCDTITICDSSMCSSEESLINQALNYCSLRGASLEWYEFVNQCDFDTAHYYGVRFLACGDTGIIPPSDGCDTIDLNDSNRCRDMKYWIDRAYHESAIRGKTLIAIDYIDQCGENSFGRIRIVCCGGVTPPPVSGCGGQPLRLIMPYWGTTYYAGDSLPIQWCSDTNVSSGVVISISFDAGLSYHQIGDAAFMNVPGSSNYTIWNIPDSLDGVSTASSNCLVRISDYVNQSHQALSDSFFTIVGQSPLPCVGCADSALHVNSPNGGEIFRVGDSILINWSANPNGISSSWPEISFDGGKIFARLTDMPFSGGNVSYTFSWQIPRKFNGVSTASKKCMVRVRDFEGRYSDYSDGTFAIQR